MENFLLAYKDKFYRFALRLTGNSDDADDIMQELAIKIWKKGKDFEKIENKEAWCMTVTRNLSIDKIRSNKSREHSNIEDAYKVSTDMRSPDHQMESDDIMNKLKKLIASLPENYKTVIQLREIEEMTYKEIAEIMNIDLHKVKIYIFRARKMLQQLILDSNLKTI
jgi:RNA polymerase sigma-70 factor (ECF subfamily)